eukprot:gene3413-3876_t
MSYNFVSTVHKPTSVSSSVTGDAEGTIGRPAENGQIGIIDSDNRAIALHLYEGLLKIVPIERGVPINETFNVRLEELQVIDMVFLNLSNSSGPVLAILYKDTRDARHVSTYVINMRDKNLDDGPWQQSNVEENASRLIPIASGGVLVVGEHLITHVRGNHSPRAVSIPHTVIVAHERVDRDRYLFADDEGVLYILVISFDKDLRVTDMRWERLGSTSIASSISYLDAGVVYIGSASGDSQLIRLNTERDTTTDSFITLLESFNNLGPISDFCMTDVEKQGQGQIITCSGTFKDSSLRVVRNGIGIAEKASIDLDGIRGIWALHGSQAGNDRYLIVSFIGSTKVLSFSGEEIEDIEISGFDSNSPTLYCGNIGNSQFLQIASSGIYLIDRITGMRNDLWMPDKGVISLASRHETQVIVAQGKTLYYFEIRSNKINLIKETMFPHEISCLEISAFEGQSKAMICAVGLWTDISIRLLSIPTLDEVCKEMLGGDVLPRSILLITFEGTNYLLCSLGDGHLLNFTLDTRNNTLNERKKLSLGTQPITLNRFRLRNTVNVFASSDRPTVIYSNNKKLLYSVVNLRVVSHVCSFNSDAFPDCIAIANDTSLTIGTIDEIQKLHIRTIPLNGEMARRIVHWEENNCYAIITMRRGRSAGADGEASEEKNFIRLINDQTFEMIGQYQLGQYECGWSITTCKFNGDDTTYLVVGTDSLSPLPPVSGGMPREAGRILVFRVHTAQLLLIEEVPVRGTVYSLLAFNGRLLAAINKRVQAFSWNGEQAKLKGEAVYKGHTLSLYLARRGDFVVVGDLMKSMSLLVEEPGGAIKEIARNPQPIWLTAVEMIDDDSYIGSDNSFNFVVVKKNTDTTNELERELLDSVGHFHVGDSINKFYHGSLVTLPDVDAPRIPTILFATVNGSIGVIVSISKEDYDFFFKLQAGLNRVVKGVGGLDHKNWRSFCNEHTTVEASNFIDGDVIETFMDLKQDKMLEAIKDLDISIEDTYRKIESLLQHIR